MEPTGPDPSSNQAYQDASDLDTRLRLQDQHRTHPENWYRWVFERLDLPEGGRLLELGSGSGWLWLENLDRWVPPERVVMTDLSNGILNETRQRLTATWQGSGPEPIGQTDFCQLTAFQLPFPEASFDVVLALGLLDVLDDPQQAFQEIHRVLKPGGSLYASAGGQEHLGEMEALIGAFTEGVSYGGFPDRFGLENGINLLSPWFQTVRREVYENRLRFEKAKPLLEYLLSEPEARAALDGEVLGGFVHYLKAKLSRNQPFYVTSRKGLFRARKNTRPA